MRRRQSGRCRDNYRSRDGGLMVVGGSVSVVLGTGNNLAALSSAPCDGASRGQS